jgi:hypothetical protein
MTTDALTLERKTDEHTPTRKTDALAPELLRKLHAYWRAANYLSVGQIYLYDNPLLRAPLRPSVHSQLRPQPIFRAFGQGLNSLIDRREITNRRAAVRRGHAA